MAKILITLIGTGRQAKGDDTDNKYETTNYILEDKLYENLTFTSNAIIEHFDIDKVFYIGTNLSMWDNVAEYFGDDELGLELLEKKDGKELVESDLKKLDKLIDNKLNSYGSKCFIIKDGENEDELWNIFNKFLEILENINNNDEVYFDITHLFRSVSVMSFIIAEFGKIYKNFKMKGFFYGMLKQNEPSRIIDVGMFFELLEWAKAIDAIKHYSDFNPLVRLLDENKIEKDVQNTFVNLNNTIGLANISSIRQFIQSASKKIKSIENSENRIIKLLAPEILKLVEELDEEIESNFQYTLSKWFYKNKNYALCYIALYEAIITKSCELSNYDIGNHRLREEAKKSIGNDKYGKLFYTKYPDSISVIRNSIVHQSNDRKQLVASDIVKLKKFIDFFEDYFKIGIK